MTTGSVLAFALAIAIAPQSLAATSSPDASELTTPPTWIEPPSPTPDEYPLFVSILGITSEVQVECRVSDQGHPVDCQAVSSRPTGLGFEPIAVAIVERGRLSPARDENSAVESDITVRVPFSIDSDPFPPPPSWEGPEPSPAQRAAGEVYARRVLLDPAYRSDARWGLQDMPTAMRDTVRDWVDELFRDDMSFRTLSLAMARVLARRGLDRMPSEEPADWSDWVAELQSAKSGYFDAQAANIELRRRYCARYDCGPAVALP
ncbi:Gram-negative bacterial tonB protein [compost metagenome]